MCGPSAPSDTNAFPQVIHISVENLLNMWKNIVYVFYISYNTEITGGLSLQSNTRNWKSQESQKTEIMKKLKKSKTYFLNL